MTSTRLGWPVLLLASGVTIAVWILPYYSGFYLLPLVALLVTVAVAGHWIHWPTVAAVAATVVLLTVITIELLVDRTSSIGRIAYVDVLVGVSTAAMWACGITLSRRVERSAISK